MARPVWTDLVTPFEFGCNLFIVARNLSWIDWTTCIQAGLSQLQRQDLGLLVKVV